MPNEDQLLKLMQLTKSSNEVENVYFKKFLRDMPSAQIDEAIHKLNKLVEEEIDCTQCGNCCKNLEPGLADDEIMKLAEIDGMDALSYRRKFVEYDGDTLYLKTKPCKYLDACKCTIYIHRPAACSGFPHLDGVQLKYKRSLWQNYHICPIVYTVIERLKQQLGFAHYA
jgi:Fe-S-cluster containining protein